MELLLCNNDYLNFAFCFLIFEFFKRTERNLLWIAHTIVKMAYARTKP